MRKVKKVNGFLIVQFSERERREYEELGTYGVIDPDLYTGDIDVDRGAMEYTDADALKYAVEQARGLKTSEDDDEA